MSPIVITLLFVVGCGGFGWLAWCKLSILPKLQREPQITATACPYCALRINDGMMARGRGEQVLYRSPAQVFAKALQVKAKP